MPCFSFAKTLRKSPAIIADELKDKLSGHEFIEQIESSNGYLNFFIKKAILFKDVITDILCMKNAYGSSKSALSFEGDSGPYLQYSLARINSIFRKYGKELPFDINYTALQGPLELELVKELASFSDAIKVSLKELSPHIIVNYVYGLQRNSQPFITIVLS